MWPSGQISRHAIARRTKRNGLDGNIFQIYNRRMASSNKRRGRPKQSAGTAKSASVLLRLDSQEVQAFFQAANLAGVPRAVWMRERLRIAARQELENAGQPVPFIPVPGTKR